MSKSEKQGDLADREIEVMFLSSVIKSAACACVCVCKFWSETSVLVPEFVV